MVQSAYSHSCFRCLAFGRYHTVAVAVTPVRAPRRCEPKKTNASLVVRSTRGLPLCFVPCRVAGFSLRVAGLLLLESYRSSVTVVGKKVVLRSPVLRKQEMTRLPSLIREI